MILTPRKLIKAIKVTGVTLLVAAITLAAAPLIETHYFPVLSNVQITQMPTEKGNTVSLAIAAKMVRTCTLVSRDAIVLKDGGFEHGQITLNHNDYTVEPGLVKFGIWDIMPTSDLVQLQVTHRCHPGWDTKTIIATWSR